jgi:hypothetical protein
MKMRGIHFKSNVITKGAVEKCWGARYLSKNAVFTVNPL